MVVSEGDDLSRKLSIVKANRGSPDNVLSFEVLVIPGTAQNGTGMRGMWIDNVYTVFGTQIQSQFSIAISFCVLDYLFNIENPIYSQRTVPQLPIKTRLLQDQVSEAAENFTICLPDAQVLQPMGAAAVYPSCVTITIIDDDCKAILLAIMIHV